MGLAAGEFGIDSYDAPAGTPPVHFLRKVFMRLGLGVDRCTQSIDSIEWRCKVSGIIEISFTVRGRDGNVLGLNFTSVHAGLARVEDDTISH
jgi:hypothetical protein